MVILDIMGMIVDLITMDTIVVAILTESIADIDK
jgi:hypothetical protein